MLREMMAVLPRKSILMIGLVFMLPLSTAQTQGTVAATSIIYDEKIDCSQVSHAQDSCAFVKKHCPGFDSDGLIPYLQLYYCTASSARPYLLVGMFVWLMVLFASMALAAGDFLTIHLAVIVTILGISHDLAGVTIFAFGNGSSDFFSTLAAMNQGTGSLAINELFGAAAFITTVVLGLVAMSKPFSINCASLIRNVVWFMIAAVSLTGFLADGKLALGECLGIIGIYIAFVVHSLLSMRTSRETSVATAETEARIAVEETTSLLSVREDRLDGDHDTPSAFAENDLAEEPGSEQLRVATSTFSLPIVESISKMFPPIQTWKDQSIGERILTAFSLPLMIPIGLTTLSIQPVSLQQESAAIASYDRLFSVSLLKKNLTILPQLLLGPQFVALVLANQFELPLRIVVLVLAAALLFSILLVGFNLTTRFPTARQLTNAFVGFAVSLLWIFLTATSAVSLLTTLGFILQIPTTILGGTIFAIGNSSNDLVANTAVARRGMPALAASACFGGPMLNMLLGIGIGGLLQVLKDGAPSGDARGVYTFDVYPGMFVSSGMLLIGLVLTLAYAFWKGWRLDRQLSLALILVWVAGTIVNLVISTTGRER